MTVAEAATRLGISPSAVRTLVAAGKLPHHRPTLGGRRIVLAEADVERYWAETRHHGSMPSRPLRYVSLDCKYPFARN